MFKFHKDFFIFILFIRVINLNINYHLIIKDKSFPFLVLIHGWGTDSSYMKCFLNVKDYNYLALDLPGFGKSIIEKPYDIPSYVDDIHNLLVKLKINYFVGLGHSFGGKILYYYSLTYPCEVEKLFLIAPSLFLKKSFKTRKKIFLFHLFKKLHIKIPSFLKGSSDYQKASDIMKKTLSNVTRPLINKKDLENLNIEIYLFAFNKDKEVPLKGLKKVSSYLPLCHFYILNGEHFSYFSHIRFIKALLEMEQ